MSNIIRWGLDNPHPFSQMKTELIWEGKYDEYGNRIRQDILKEKRAEYGKEIVVSLIRQLSWTHFIALIPLKNDLQRDFYAEMCRVER